MAVTVETEGLPEPLPAGLDLTLYRVVQEALTNVVKHAPHARAPCWCGTGRARSSSRCAIAGRRERAAPRRDR